MRRIVTARCIVGLVFFSLAAWQFVRPAVAQPAKEQQVRELLAAMRAEKQFDQVISGITKQVWNLILPRVPALPDDLRASLQREMQTEFRANSALFVEAMIPIYQKHLTGEEVVALTAFMKTKAGRALIEKMPKIQVEGFQVGAQIGEVLGRKAAENVISKLRAKGYKL
jgi:uncharacterized protein